MIGEMTAAETAFLELLRKGLEGREPDHRLFGELAEPDWESIYGMAKRQTVCGVCYASFCRLPDPLLPGGSLLPRWVARVNAIETRNAGMQRALSELIAMFRRAGLHPVVQKGLSVARFYGNPELRESGDIDLWLSGDELRRGTAIVSELDGTPVRHPDGSVSFSYKGFVVEFHSTLVSICNPVVASRLDAYARRQCVEGGYGREAIPSPAPMLEMLLLDVHIMRHAFGNGVGLRQVCDYVLAARALDGKYDRREFGRWCRVLGISRWTALLNEYAVSLLDADPAALPPAGRETKGELPVEKLHDIITQGGNFGQHLKGRASRPDKSRGSKLHTLAMLARRSRFAAAVAPAEAFWNFVRLMAGQIH